MFVLARRGVPHCGSVEPPKLVRLPGSWKRVCVDAPVFASVTANVKIALDGS